MCNIEPRTAEEAREIHGITLDHGGQIVAVDVTPSQAREIVREIESSLRPKTILEEAAEITSVDRNKTYGPPLDNHSRTAALIAAYLSGVNGREIDFRDTCWLNVLQKASRDVFHRQRDNLVDAAGYLRNIEMAENDEGR